MYVRLMSRYTERNRNGDEHIWTASIEAQGEQPEISALLKDLSTRHELPGTVVPRLPQNWQKLISE